jgi:IS605 OrfB family transposase
MKGGKNQARDDGRIFTYQTRLRVLEAQEVALAAYADLHGQVERYLFVAMIKGGKAGQLKPEFMSSFGLTARQYNAIAIGLRGKIASIKERRGGLIKEAEARITKAQQVLGKLKRQRAGADKIHQKTRRLATTQARLATMKQDHQSGRARLCFGSKKLFGAQFNLAANGYDSLDAWRKDWKAARSSQFLVIGSKDETGGCQGCVARLQPDGSLSLRLRLPDALAKAGKHLELHGVKFAYGHDNLLAALVARTAISYRFVRDKTSWRVMASTAVVAPTLISRRALGAIGVDINSDHLAVAEVDGSGNFVGGRKIGCLTYGKTSEQAKAQIGEAAKQIAELALKSGKPVVIEKLDFTKKKAETETMEPRAARQLSSFAYNQTSQAIHSACFKRGVEVIEVNPAFTSVIGATNHAQRYGISVHLGAALAIARRGMGLSESPTVRMGVVPVHNGSHVTFSLPARNRQKHVWSFWSQTKTRLKVAHKVHARSGLARANPAPLPPRATVGATWALPVRIRHANRWHSGSANVMADFI